MEVYQEVKPNKLLQFEVMSIKSERKENGNSLIEFQSIEDEPIIFNIALPTKYLNDKETLKLHAMIRYNKCVTQRVQDKEYAVKVGDVI